MSSSLGGKVQFALGLFIRVSDLEDAVKELCAAGLPLRQIKVIAPPEESGPEPSWASCASGFGLDTWIVSGAGGPCPWDFTPVGHPEGAKRDVMPGFHLWALERHARQLDRHLRGGGGIAVVQVTTEAEERAAYSSLLRHATAGVQTHQVSRQP